MAHKSLAEFHTEQVQMIRKAGEGFRTLLSINPLYDLRAGIRQWLHNHPMGKGVSEREVLEEVRNPGTFK